MWHAIGCLACIVVLWIRLDGFGASEFSGGRLTGLLFRMAELGSLLFLVALLVTFFLRQFAAVIALAATLLCLPFYLYNLMPRPYGWIFRGEGSVPLHGRFNWDSGAIIGIFCILLVGILSFRRLFQNARGRIVS